MTRRPIFRTVLALFALLSIDATAPAQQRPSPRPLIAMTAIVDHASVDAMRQGIEDGLQAGGLRPGEDVTITYESAEASLARADEIARALVGSDTDLVIALSEPSARAMATQRLRIPIVMAGISLAKADAIVADRQARRLTGVASGDVHTAQIKLIAAIRPETDRVLVPFSTPDRSQSMMRALTAAARPHSFVVEAYRLPGEAADAAELLPAGIAPKSTVVYLTQDAAGKAADALIREARRRGIPIIADSRDLVIRGATATIIHDDYAIGEQVGNMAATILRNPSRARQPIRTAEARFLVVNGETSDDDRLALAIDLTEIANEVIEWAKPNGPHPVVKPSPPQGSDVVPP